MQAGNGGGAHYPDPKSGLHSSHAQPPRYYSTSPHPRINSFSSSSREINDMPWMEASEDSDMLTQSGGLDGNYLTDDSIAHPHLPPHLYASHSDSYDGAHSAAPATSGAGMNYLADEAFEALNHLSNMVRAASQAYPELLETGGPDQHANGLLGARQQLLEWLQQYSTHSNTDPLSSQYSPRPPTYKFTNAHYGPSPAHAHPSTAHSRGASHSQITPAVAAHAARVEREWSQSTADDYRDNSSSSWGTTPGMDMGMGDSSPASPDDVAHHSASGSYPSSRTSLQQGHGRSRSGREDSISDTVGSFDATALMPPTKRSRYMSSANVPYSLASSSSNPESPSLELVDGDSNRALQHANEARRASPTANSGSSPHPPSTALAHIQPFANNNGNHSGRTTHNTSSAAPGYGRPTPAFQAVGQPFSAPNSSPFSAPSHVPAWVQDKHDGHASFNLGAGPSTSAFTVPQSFPAVNSLGHSVNSNVPPHLLPPIAPIPQYSSQTQPFGAAPTIPEPPLTVDQRISRSRQQQLQSLAASESAPASSGSSKRSNKHAATMDPSYDPPIITKTVSKTGRPLPPVSVFRINPSKSTPLPQVDPNAPRPKGQQSKTPASLASMIAPGLMDSFDWKPPRAAASSRKRNHAATQTASSGQSSSQHGVTTAQHGQSLENAKLSDFQVLNVLGTGTFGKVHLCRHKTTGLYYCLKVLKKQTIFRFKQMDHIENEKHLLLQLRYPGIVQLYATFTTEDSLVMLMEYVPGGELFYYIRRSGRLDESIARLYAAELVCTIMHLHERNIVYRDLKPENILLDTTGHLKLADFGFAKRVVHKTWTMCGTPDYLAPEIINGKGHDTAVDWWSLGVLIFEMLAGYPPFTDKDMGTLFRKIQEPEKLIIPVDFSQEASDLVRRLLVADPTSRLGNIHPDIADIRTHPWFRPVHWDQITARASTGPIIPAVQNPGEMGTFQEEPSQETTAPFMPIPEDVQRIFDRF